MIRLTRLAVTSLPKTPLRSYLFTPTVCRRPQLYLPKPCSRASCSSSSSGSDSGSSSLNSSTGSSCPTDTSTMPSESSTTNAADSSGETAPPVVSNDRATYIARAIAQLEKDGDNLCIVDIRMLADDMEWEDKHGPKLPHDAKGASSSGEEIAPVDDTAAELQPAIAHAGKEKRGWLGGPEPNDQGERVVGYGHNLLDPDVIGTVALSLRPDVLAIAAKRMQFEKDNSTRDVTEAQTADSALLEEDMVQGTMVQEAWEEEDGSLSFVHVPADPELPAYPRIDDYADLTPSFYSDLERVFGIQQYTPAPPPTSVRSLKGVVHGERKRCVFPMRVSIGRAFEWVFFLVDGRNPFTSVVPDTPRYRDTEAVEIEGMMQGVKAGSVNVIGRDFLEDHGAYLVAFDGNKVKMVFGGRGKLKRDTEGIVGEEEEEDGNKVNGKANRIVLQRVKTAELTPREMIGGENKQKEGKQGKNEGS